MSSANNFLNVSVRNQLGEDFSEAPNRRNFYNSTIGEESIEEDVDITDDNLQEEMINRVTCSCKGQCAKRRGKGACVCRTQDLKCDAACSCNKSKCKNKDSVSERSQGDPESAPISNGAEAFATSVQQSREEIMEFVESLDREKQVELLCKLLSMGRGSLDFARKALTPGAPDQPPDPPREQPPWCKCNVCRPMETEQENVCCKKRTCITSYTAFNNICLDRDILEVCIKARCDIRADEFNFTMASFRKAAYRQYTLWTYGKLGRGNRRVIPACVVRMIRQTYPAPDGRHMGYKSS